VSPSEDTGEEQAEAGDEEEEEEEELEELEEFASWEARERRELQGLQLLSEAQERAQRGGGGDFAREPLQFAPVYSGGGRAEEGLQGGGGRVWGTRRRGTATLSSSPHTSAWPTILGRGPVALIERFPVSSRADVVSGSDAATADWLRGDGSTNVYHPYISNTLLTVEASGADIDSRGVDQVGGGGGGVGWGGGGGGGGGGAAAAAEASAAFVGRRGVAELLDRLTNAIATHLSTSTFRCSVGGGGAGGVVVYREIHVQRREGRGGVTLWGKGGRGCWRGMSER
jgi:hypothetical protein